MIDSSKALPIVIQGLTKKYGSLYALDSVDLDVSSGEFLTLLGPSGSGKTTLLMAIAGFNRPDSGSIRFGDTEMIQISYSMGGMSISAFQADVKNPAYDSDATTHSATEVSIGLAF